MGRPAIHSLDLGTDATSARRVADALAADGWNAQHVTRAHNDVWVTHAVVLPADPDDLPPLWVALKAADLEGDRAGGPAGWRTARVAALVDTHRRGRVGAAASRPVCRSCGLAVHGGRGDWWHVDTGEMACADGHQLAAPDRAATAEAAFLAGYQPDAYPRVAIASDVVLLTIRDGALCVLLVQRADHPFRGVWALPGGFVGPDQDAHAAAAATLSREAGLSAGQFHLEQLATYTAPDRDPRMRVASVAHVALAPEVPDPVAGRDTAQVRFFAVADLGLGLTAEEPDAAAQLAFDHARIVTDAVERARAKLEYTTLATRLVTAPFTIGDLRRIYEAVWGVVLHAGNFHRKVIAADGFVVATDRTDDLDRPGRPAQLYRPGPAAWITPPLARAGT